MIEDFSIEYLNQKGLSEQSQIGLSDVEKWLNSEDLMKQFKDWRLKMWKELLKTKDFKNRDNIWKETALKSPSMHGLKYKDYKKLKPAYPQTSPRHDL